MVREETGDHALGTFGKGRVSSGEPLCVRPVDTDGITSVHADVVPGTKQTKRNSCRYQTTDNHRGAVKDE